MGKLIIMQPTIEIINEGVEEGDQEMILLANKINGYEITPMEGYLILG